MPGWKSASFRRQAGSQGSRPLLMWSFPQAERSMLIWPSDSVCRVEGGYQQPLLITVTVSRTCCVQTSTRCLSTPNNNKKEVGGGGAVCGLDDNWAIVCASGRNNFSGTGHGSEQWTVWAFTGEVRLNRQWCALHLWHCWEKKRYETQAGHWVRTNNLLCGEQKYLGKTSRTIWCLN